jgi:hypothetical protein
VTARVVSIKNRPATFRSTEQNQEADLARATELATWLDSKFEIPGVGIRFGIDAILGLLPGVGDLLTSVASLYILAIATRNGVPRVTQARMAANIAADWLVGSIPVLGDLLDVAWKANQMNVALLRRHLLATTEEQRRHQRRDWLFLGLLMAGLMCVLAVAVTIAYFLVTAIWRAIN